MSDKSQSIINYNYEYFVFVFNNKGPNLNNYRAR